MAAEGSSGRREEGEGGSGIASARYAHGEEHEGGRPSCRVLCDYVVCVGLA